MSSIPQTTDDGNSVSDFATKFMRGISYDTMNAHVAIVFSRYMMLSVAQRENEDDKTICELCFCLLDETEDITFSRSMCIIIDVLMDTVMEYFHITEARLEEFTASFVQALFSVSPNICGMHWNGERQLHNSGVLISIPRSINS